jgi:hypothetical protein
MHEVAFHELTRTGFVEEDPLHPSVTPWGMPRPLIEPADRRLRGGEGFQHGVHLKGLNFVCKRIHEISGLIGQANVHFT